MFPLLLTITWLAREKPSLSNAVKVVDVLSALLLLGTNLWLTPLTASKAKCHLEELSLSLIQTQSGWNPTPVIDCVELLPA